MSNNNVSGSPENEIYELRYLQLNSTQVQTWSDLLEDDEIGRLVKAIWLTELRIPGSYDDSEEGKAFRAMLSQIRRDVLPAARISAERVHAGRVQGGKTTAAQNAAARNAAQGFKAPSRTKFRKIFFDVVSELINKGRRDEKVSNEEADQMYTVLECDSFMLYGEIPCRSDSDIKDYLRAHLDKTLITLAQHKESGLIVTDKANVDKAYHILVAEETLRNSKGELQAYNLICEFFSRKNSRSGQWDYDGVKYSFKEWEDALHEFVQIKLKELEPA